jgi:hypothetical protein
MYTDYIPAVPEVGLLLRGGKQVRPKRAVDFILIMTKINTIHALHSNSRMCKKYRYFYLL